MADKPTPSLLLQMIEQNDDKQEEGHHRLREDFRALEARLNQLENARAMHEAGIRQLNRRQTDIKDLRFDLRTVVAVSIVAGSLGIWQWNMKTELMRAVTENATTQDAKFIEQGKAIEDLRKEFRLLQNNVTDFMINQSRQKGGAR